MLTRHTDYDRLYQDFAWRIPNRYNIGVDTCDRHADGTGRLALIFVAESGAATEFSFDHFRRQSNRFANTLLAHGFARGDRLAILLPQTPETAIAHLAAFKAGLISVPLFTLFGEEALQFRLSDSGATGIVTDEAGAEKLRALHPVLPALRHIYVIGHGRSFETALDRASDSFVPVDTNPDDPALLVYTSGTTGNPKGALHAHRVLLGHLPGVELPQDFFPQPNDRFWTPADWAWVGGLLDVLLPAWHHGMPVVAHRARKFDPLEAVDLMVRHQIRNTFLPPTALKLMRMANVPPTPGLRSIGSGGETLGAELLDWATATFGVTPNEFYGQTECNLVAGNNGALFPIRPGSLGRAIPGHTVAIVDEAGREVPAGQIGTVAVRRPDPVMFLGYWNNPTATAEKYAGDYLLTGDQARQDEDGYLWFAGRSDDLITSAGYRIGPGEIEDCLIKHAAVSMAAVAGIPDPVRTEAVKAWIVLRPGVTGSPDLARDIQAFVRSRLAAHEYPRHVEFVDELPMTATGKIIRRQLRERG
ncbi:acyl-CoA synthetase [Acidisphaera sp. S103]|uniref:acyl-CoA synthetase n=1 Tax=Acidisphaera sp. S103 TaxID=1747223 RepID=UPI00131E6C64|nr:acyl-CoA synthetase [Acidisphaera sp. S103]